MSRNGHRPARGPGSDALISVIISNYNYARYLERAVESLAEQTHGPIALHLVDDASTDASRPLIARLARRFRSRFASVETSFRDENRGSLACLNLVLSRSSGVLALMLDADDVLCPTFLEDSIGDLLEHRRHDPSVAFVYTDCELIDCEGRPLGIGRSAAWDRELLQRSSYIPGCAVTLTDALRACSPFDESIRVGTKHHRWLRLSRAGWAGRHLPRPLFSYRLHAHNNSGIGVRLLPELNADHGSEQVLARAWPTAEATGLRG
jgi:glycosyltransferase involved in cell wall biosynthesis